MALSRDCILGAIYPLKGHESAIGLNLLEHPFRRRIVESTIKTGNTFVAGPVELVEGGVAFISYTPIFTKPEIGNSKFWGVTDIVILKDKLFNEVNLRTRDSEYKFALKGVDGRGLSGSCFWGDSTIFNNSPVTVDILLPTGKWVMASVPANGWESSLNKTEKITIILYVSALIISILIGLLAKAMIKIKENERELKAMFGSMQDLVIVFNKKGEYIKIAPTDETLLVKPAKELLGKTIHQVFDKKAADYFLNAIIECIETKKMVFLDYPLEIDSRNYWFHATISYLTYDSVLFVAHDYTIQKEALEELKQSRQKLVETNAAKDKFFSIIAHDLKSPFLGIMGVTEELKLNIDKLEKEEISEFVNLMYSAAKNTFDLLNNLLEWSSLQTGRMVYKPDNLNIYSIVQNTCELLNTSASVKSICIENKVTGELAAFADKNMVSTIMRNLVSNAIKFTKPGGKISVSSYCENGFVLLSISDTGIGMTEEMLMKIFKIDSVHISRGTNGEKGTGLGLLLCKELVEKNGGEIRVTSSLGIGTEFTFSLPVSSKKTE
jgi:signal transduction histidine kinase